jgi:glycosyltransferase involved in cell wall biosynthesis
MKTPGILFVGSFLAAQAGTNTVGTELSSRLSARGWTTLETSRQVNRVFRLLDMLTSAILHRREYQAAYIEVYSGLAFLWAEIMVRLMSLLQKPVVLVLHGGGLAELAQKYPPRVTRLLRQGQKIVTPSLFLQGQLQECHPAIDYLPNAVEVSRYEFQPRDKSTPHILWLRAFHEVYQPQLAIKAIALLAGEFKDLSLTMIGPDKKDGSLSSALALAKKMGVASRIRVAGSIPRSEVPSWLASGEIFLNTTRLESFGLGVLEAALVGLPIVTTNVGEIPFLWEDEMTALLVPSDDPAAMAHALRRLLTDPLLANYLSQNARCKAEQFDWSVVLPRWERLFLEAAHA